MTANQIVFLVLAAVAGLAAVGVVGFGNNPVRAALLLVLNFFVLGFIYFTLGAQLLGISQIMVYAGAIMVLFLFVIMMLQLHQRSLVVEGREGRGVLAWLFGLALAVVVYASVIVPLMSVSGSPIGDEYGTPQSVGRVLFTTYVLPFEIASVLLLIGIVGSILLAKRRL